MSYSIITGASSGIGKSLATECARRGRNLILVSLPDEGLSDVALSLADRFDVRAEYYETDLTADGAVGDFYDWCRKRDFSIDLLINNAGIGRQGVFELSSPDEIRSMMRLNMEVVVSMCRGGIPLLRKQEKSFILNVGSIGSFTPVPYKTVYSATKHFVLAFSDALHYELRDSPIFVGCLCPGPTLTNSTQRRKVEEQGLLARLVTKTSDEVASAGMEGLMNGRRTIVPGLANRLFRGLSWLLPLRLRLRWAGATFSGSKFNKT